LDLNTKPTSKLIAEIGGRLRKEINQEKRAKPIKYFSEPKALTDEERSVAEL
jgi:hypothetical protein